MRTIKDLRIKPILLRKKPNCLVFISKSKFTGPSFSNIGDRIQIYTQVRIVFGFTGNASEGHFYSSALACTSHIHGDPFFRRFYPPFLAAE